MQRSRIVRSVLLSVFALLLLQGTSVQAGYHEYTLEPLMKGATYAGGSGIYHGTPTIGTWYGPGVYTYWEKFSIPFFDNETIVEVRLNVDVSSQYSSTYHSGVYIYYVADDTWSSSTIHSDWPVGDSVMNRYATDNGSTPLGLVSSNITGFVNAAGEGQGSLLSVSLRHSGGGIRGALLDYAPTLTIITADAPEATAWSRGQDLIMKHGLQIQAQVFNGEYPAGQSFDLARWAESNFTTVNMQWTSDPNFLGAAPGVPWARWRGSALDEHADGYLENFVSYQYQDEQDMDQATNRTSAANTFANWRIEYPNVLHYTNQGPGFDSDASILAYMQEALPDMLMQDVYVFDSSSPSLSTLYYHMKRYRDLALQGCDPNNPMPIPYGIYTQTYKKGGHNPSDSELRLNQFAAWTFGCKFVSAFLYNTYAQHNLYATLFNGEGDANPTAAFYQMAETNRQSRNLGESLTRLVSTDFSMVGGDKPANVKIWEASDPCNDPYITNISSSYPVLVGYFKPLDESFDGDIYGDQDYFMITNGRSGSTATVAQTQATITIDFDFGASGITSLQRVSRDTGEVEVVSLTPNPADPCYTLSLTLPGGTGDLFKFNTGAPFINGPYACGDPGTEYVKADISGANGQPDCHVNEIDLAVMADQWLADAPSSFEHTIQATVRGATYAGETGFRHTTPILGYWSGHSGSARYWEKFDIPEFPGQVITQVLINVDVKKQYNSPYTAGVYVYRVDDDSWTSATIHSDWPVDESVTNRYASDSGATPYGLVSSDITGWLTLVGEGAGQELSLSLRHAGGGARGALLNYRPTLTIITEPLAAGTLSADIDGNERVDLADFAILADDWLTSTDPAE